MKILPSIADREEPLAIYKHIKANSWIIFLDTQNYIKRRLVDRLRLAVDSLSTHGQHQCDWSHTKILPSEIQTEKSCLYEAKHKRN